MLAFNESRECDRIERYMLVTSVIQVFTDIVALVPVYSTHSGLISNLYTRSIDEIKSIQVSMAKVEDFFRKLEKD